MNVLSTNTAGKKEKNDDTGTRKPSQWKNFALETLLLLWVDYIRMKINWREAKLKLLRDVVGAPSLVTEKGRKVERLTGGIRFVTNLIELDSNDEATAARTRKRFSKLDNVVRI